MRSAPWGLNVVVPLAAAGVRRRVRAGLDADARRPAAGRARRGHRRLGRARRSSIGSRAGSPEAADGAPNPLDRYTKRVADAAAAAALAPFAAAHAVYFPFDGAEPLIPFQRLGRAAGLGGPGPLGLQIHPVFGPWWAYRALVVVDRELPPRAADRRRLRRLRRAVRGRLSRRSAVARAGFAVAACHARRLIAEPCRLSCAARIACVRGPEHRYTDAQLAFHMAASMPEALAARLTAHYSRSPWLR